MSPILFWIFSGLMLLFAALVVLHRSPIASALSLVVSFLALAALFVSLDAFFLGVIQVLVYAGAVMVLFLFIIMLLDLKEEAARRINYTVFGGGLLLTAALAGILAKMATSYPGGHTPAPALPQHPLDDVRHIGLLLFSEYHLPLQAIACLVLAATIGVIVLSKKELH